MLGAILNIILIILKIIGIALLVIFGIILVLIFTALFVPIRYKSSGDFAKNEDGFNYQALANISWLFHIFSFSVYSKDKVTALKIKLFGIDITSKLTSDKPPKDKTKIKKKKRTPSKVNEEAVKSEQKMLELSMESENIEVREEKKARINDNKPKEVQGIEETQTEEKSNKLKEKLNILKKIIEKIKSIFEKIKKICDKIKNVNDVKNSFIDYLKKDDSRIAIKEIKHIILKVLKHILPTKLKAKIGFGFEEPCTTGNVLGIASIFYGIYGDNLILEPDFDNKVLYGEYMLKGRIRAFTLLIAAFKIYRNKWIKEFVSFSKKAVKDM